MAAIDNVGRRVIVAGGSGLIGRGLVRLLLADGYDPVVLSRKPSPSAAGSNAPRSVAWDAVTAGPWIRELEGALAVVNLAGENIAAGRWSRRRKVRILDSRKRAAAALVQGMRSAADKPRVMIQASAIGFYGDRGDEMLDETSSGGKGFLAEVVRQWEDAATEVSQDGVRLAWVRFGAVLAADGGLLPRLLPLFRLGMGGLWGDGRQWLSWVHLADAVQAVKTILENANLSGCFNLTSPTPVRVAEFSRVLGEVLERSARRRAPALAIKLALGELGREVLLSSQRVTPRRLRQFGYRFRFEDVCAALQDLAGVAAPAVTTRP